METHHTHLKLRSGKFSIDKHHFSNVGLTERLVSVFTGAILLSKGIKSPLKTKFLYGAYLTYRGFTGHCLLYERLGIDARRPHAVNVRGEFIIDRPAHEVYSHWRNLNNLPGSLKHLMDVKMLDEKLSAWKSRVLGNLVKLDWKAEIVKDEPNHLIGWRSTTSSIIKHVGKVEFTETADGLATKLRIVISYYPPAGGLGIGIARLLNPYFEHLLTNEIKTFKQQIELPIM